MSTILNLPNWNVTMVTETPDQYQINASYDIIPDTCVHCRENFKIYKHGTRLQTIFDIPFHSKHVLISVSRKRYHCRSCNRTFLQPLPDIDDRGTMTNRLVLYIKSQSLYESFTNIAAAVGVSEGTIRNIFSDSHPNQDYKTPSVLGINQIILLNDNRTIISDVNRQCVIDILPSCSYDDIAYYFTHMPDPHQIRYITMNMWSPYRHAVQDILNIPIFIEKFYVVNSLVFAIAKYFRMSRNTLGENYSRLSKQDLILISRRQHQLTNDQILLLDAWQMARPLFRSVYEAKEEFCEIYNSKDRHEAAERFQNWESRMSPDVQSVFKSFVTSFNSWRQEILNCFDYWPIDEADEYAEMLADLIATIQHNRRGHSFDVLRTKMLIGGRDENSFHASEYKYQHIFEVIKEMKSENHDPIVKCAVCGRKLRYESTHRYEMDASGHYALVCSDCQSRQM